MSSGETLINSNSAPKEHIIAARLRGMADKCFYMPLDEKVLEKLEHLLSEAVNLHPEAVETYILMAKAYEILKEKQPRIKEKINKQMLDILNVALEYDSKNTEVKLMLAALLSEIQNFKLAAEYLGDIIERIKDSSTLEQAGNCFFAIGDYDKALVFYTFALSLQPRNHNTHIGRGYCLYRLGAFHEALSEAGQALILRPGFKIGISLKKDCVNKASKGSGLSPKQVINDFESKYIQTFKNDLFHSAYEADPLTGLANQSSLNCWTEQTEITNLCAIALHIKDLRCMSVTQNAETVNNYMSDLALGFKETFSNALFVARARADKFIAFLSALPAGLDDVVATLKRRRPECELCLGMGKSKVAKDALAQALANSVIKE